MIWPSCSRRMIGIRSISGSLDMMTPAACTPHWRFNPSRPNAVLTTSWAWGASSGTWPDGAAPALGLALGVEDPGQRHVLAHDRRGHRLGELLAHREREPHHPRGILDRLLGLDGAVSHDLGDTLLAILPGDVVDHLAAASLVEVDVEVGQ